MQKTIVYKKATRISEFNKIARYKFNVQKFYFYVPAINTKMKIAIYYNTKTTKSLNMTKDVQDLYTKNYKTLQREVKDNLNK